MENLIKKTKAASIIYMGLGHVLFLKQYIRGFLLMAFEAIMILCCTPVFGSVIPKKIYGLITLGSPKPAGTPIKNLDHSIFMMITGLITVMFLIIFVGLYIANIMMAKKSAAHLVEKQRYPSSAEVRQKFLESAFPYLGLSPALVLILFFTVLPLVFSALVAFTNYSSPHHIPPNNLVDWVGFQNFVTMFTSKLTNSWF